MVSENIELIVTTFAVFISIMGLIIAYFSYKLAINQSKNEVLFLFEKFVESCNAVLEFEFSDKKKSKFNDNRFKILNKRDVTLMMMRRLDLIYGNKYMKRDIKYYINFYAFFLIWEDLTKLFTNNVDYFFSNHLKYMKKEDFENLKNIVREINEAREKANLSRKL